MNSENMMSDPNHRWYLRRVGAFQHKRTILHLDHNEVTINRSHNATHTFQTRFISRKHASLRKLNGEWVLKDNGAINGTYLNTDRLVANVDYRLAENDIIGFGMPLSQQNEEDSVVYRLCKELVTSPSMSSRSGDTESPDSEKTCAKVVPNNHLVMNNPVSPLELKEEQMQNADETFVGPDYELSGNGQGLLSKAPALPEPVIKKESDSQIKNVPESQIPQPQTANHEIAAQQYNNAKEVLKNPNCQMNGEIICIDLEDSDDEIPPPVKQAAELSTANYKCVQPFEKSGRACVSTSVGNVINNTKGNNSFRERGTNNCNDSETTNLQTTIVLTDEDMTPAAPPTTGDTFIASDERTSTPEELSSDSESELCNAIGYSQEDELVIISDDDTYYSQKSEKAESNTALVMVKDEVIDECNAEGDLEGNDDWNNMFQEIFMVEMANDCDAEAQNQNEAARQATDDCKIMVMAEPHNDQKQVEALAVAGPSNVSVSDDDKMIEGETSDFFPVLSQNFFEGEKSSDSEEDGMQMDYGSARESSTKPKQTANCNRVCEPTQKPSTSLHKNFDRLKARRIPGEIRPCGVQLTSPLPNYKGRHIDSVSLQRPPTKARACKQPVVPAVHPHRASSRGKGPTPVRKAIKKNFVNNRIPMPGGGTDTQMGHRSPTKEKPGFHLRSEKFEGKQNKLPNYSSTSSDVVANGNSVATASSSLPQEGRRHTKFPCQNKVSRLEHLTATISESSSTAPKRKVSPLCSANKPLPKKLATEKTAAVSRKEKETSKPPKKTILLSEPACNPRLSKVPVKSSDKSNFSELGLKCNKSNKRVSFSENPPEIRYYQPDTHKGEEQIQCQNEDAFGSAPQRPEVVAALQNNLERILSWKSAWLHEQEKVKHPPPVVNSKDIKDAVGTYSTHDEYVKVYEPLLLLETWENISQEWRQRRDSCPIVQLALSKIRRDSGKSKSQSLYFYCNAIIADEDEQKGRLPLEGWLTILHVPVVSENTGEAVRSYVKLFAYVESCQRSTINYLKKDGPISPLLKQLISKHKDKKIVLKLLLQTSCANLFVSEDRLLNLEMIAYLKPQLRIFQALYCLPFTLLGPHILKPKGDLCSLSRVKSPKSLLNVGTMSYNESQRNIILKITETVGSQSASPRVCLVQGPPGTGKSSLVIGLILQLLFGPHLIDQAKPRILLCTPSNGACDQILYRLLHLRKALPGSNKLRMIRVGLPDSIQLCVKAYSLDNIVRSNIDIQKATLETQKIDLTTNLNMLQQKLDSLMLRNGKPSEVNKWKMATDERKSNLSAVVKKLNEFEHQSSEECQRMHSKWREECLKNADVIVTTLGSCTQHGMEIFLRNSNHPFICIIDEATQCIEQEILLPLQFNVSKLIMVGDPKQLPATVLSMKAKEKGLGQSLFERFYDYFVNSPKNPIVMLGLQYRMHPELNFYPSKAFYRNKLRTADGVEEKSAALPFVPYVFFDLRDSQEESTGIGDLSNPREALFIVKLCEVLLANLTDYKSISLGVITFYQQQKRLIKEKLADSTVLQNLGKAVHIEVNTVDGFQGREKELIVVSTVRANSPNGSIGFINQQRRLNVAITRAKYALFICGHRESLMVSEHWRGLINDASFRKKLQRVASPIRAEALRDLVTKSCR